MKTFTLSTMFASLTLSLLAGCSAGGGEEQGSEDELRGKAATEFAEYYVSVSILNEEDSKALFDGLMFRSLRVARFARRK